MRSTANFKGHPLHPMLVAFPVAFLTGTFIFDIIGIFFDSKGLFDSAYYLQIAGILSGLLAAFPGAMDLYTIVPPESSAYKRAIKHAVINVLTLIIFTVALFLKNAESNLYIVLFIELAGVIILSAAGWLGGTLVYRNQIAVDHRYANAGKWNEERREIVNGEVEAAALDELKTDQLKLLLVKDKIRTYKTIERDNKIYIDLNNEN